MVRYKLCMYDTTTVLASILSSLCDQGQAPGEGLPHTREKVE